MLGSILLVTYGSICVLRRLFHFMDVFFAVFVVYKLLQGQRGPLIVFLRTWERLGLTSSSSSSWWSCGTQYFLVYMVIYQVLLGLPISCTVYVSTVLRRPVVRRISWSIWTFTRGTSKRALVAPTAEGRWSWRRRCCFVSAGHLVHSGVYHWVLQLVCRGAF